MGAEPRAGCFVGCGCGGPWRVPRSEARSPSSGRVLEQRMRVLEGPPGGEAPSRGVGWGVRWGQCPEWAGGAGLG